MTGKVKEIFIYRLLLIAICFLGYLLTVAPTVSLWDCGEFIASIHIQGIAHPPGSPMYMILGKAWELLLFFIPSIAFRINLLSVFCSLTTCVVLFEIVLIIVERLDLKASLRGPCALLAGSLLAFSDTFWFNAVEAEVYAFSMMIMLLSLWVVLHWAYRSKSAHSRWILAFVYLCFAGIGVHMYSMLLFPFLYFFIGLSTRRVTPGIWIYSSFGLMAAGFSLGFVFPPLVESAFFLVPVGSLGAGLCFLAIKRQEVRDIPFWITGLLLTSVISLTKPFLVGALLLWLFLSVTLVVLKPKSIIQWVFLGLALGVLAYLYPSIPLHREFIHAGSKYILILFACLTLVPIYYIGFRGDRQERVKNGRFLQMMILMALIGYSSHIYLPVRAAQDPVINENNPVNWTRLEGFIERKQYGSESMLVRMFNRRGEWNSQFAYGANMGYFRYHSEQFFPYKLFEKLPLFNETGAMAFHSLLALGLLLVVLGVFFENIKRNPRLMLMILVLYGVTSVGLVLYMNFSDGKRIEVYHLKNWQDSAQKGYAALKDINPALPPLPNPHKVNRVKRASTYNPKQQKEILSGSSGIHYTNWKKILRSAQKHGIYMPEVPAPVRQEVRNRHYFFTPAYVFFTLMVALAFFLTLEKVIAKHPKSGRGLERTGVTLALLLWLLPFISHFKTHNRSGDFIAQDFAYNLLQSCPRGAILFTNGDNDTFPLWYLQQVEKIRLDVTVVNFSLANTDWYPPQFTRHDPKIHLPSLNEGGSFPPTAYIHFKQAQKIPLPRDSSITLKLGGKDARQLIRGQDRMLMETAFNNYPQRPLCFTYSTPERATLGLSQHFQNRGLVNVVSSTPGVDLQQFEHNLFNVYRNRTQNSEHLSSSGRWILRTYQRVIQMGKKARRQKIQQMKKDALSPAVIAKEESILKKYSELEKSWFQGAAP